MNQGAKKILKVCQSACLPENLGILTLGQDCAKEALSKVSKSIGASLCSTGEGGTSSRL